MAFIWSDKEYWERYKEGAKTEFKVFIPLFLLCVFLWYIFFKDDVEKIYLVFLSFFSTVSLFTFISIFKEFPNTAIPKHYSKVRKKQMYIFQFLISVLILIISIYKVFYCSIN